MNEQEAGMVYASSRPGNFRPGSVYHRAPNLNEQSELSPTWSRLFTAWRSWSSEHFMGSAYRNTVTLISVFGFTLGIILTVTAALR